MGELPQTPSKSRCPSAWRGGEYVTGAWAQAPAEALSTQQKMAREVFAAP